MATNFQSFTSSYGSSGFAACDPWTQTRAVWKAVGPPQKNPDGAL